MNDQLELFGGTAVLPKGFRFQREIITPEWKPAFQRSMRRGIR
jgi:hypothetical protein